MKKLLMFLVGLAIPVAALAALLFVLWVRDVRHDRKHTVIVNASTLIFAGTGNKGGCRGAVLTTLETGTKLPVRRIRYLKDCVTIDVVLPDGRSGYVVLGTGDVSVIPPLSGSGGR